MTPARKTTKAGAGERDEAAPHGAGAPLGSAETPTEAPPKEPSREKARDKDGTATWVQVTDASGQVRATSEVPESDSLGG
jgi:hypothetical protein